MKKTGPTKAGDSVDDGNWGDCPVLWVKVDPDYHWGRELVMRQPCSAWVEQLAKDGDADAQVVALRALAEMPLSIHKSANARLAPYFLADVVRGMALPSLNDKQTDDRRSVDVDGEGQASEAEEHTVAVRAEAADALARWQLMHAPPSGVASGEGESCIQHQAASAPPFAQCSSYDRDLPCTTLRITHTLHYHLATPHDHGTTTSE